MSFFFPTAEEHARHTPFPGVAIATCAGESMMMSYVELEPHAVVAEHSHPHEQVGMVLEGTLTFWIGDEEKTLGAGERYRIPGNVRHRAAAGSQKVKALDIFSPIREDYL